jgi:hypothetical protein
LGGFTLIDGEMRLFIIEGLGGRGNSMDQFYQANSRSKPNDRNFKMLYNPGVRYRNRIYQQFNCALKKIKLSNSLSKTMT